MTNDIAIKVINLTKVYHLYDKPQDRLKEALNPFKKSYHHDFYAVNDISFEIKKGETVGVIGKNGAGKSTLLKIITGVLNPTSGSIQVNGKIASLLELGAGFNPEMTGHENIYLTGTLMGFSKEDMDTKVNAILEFADIGEFIEQAVKTYSSGMFVRLAFAVNLISKPEIMIVDEALSVGDMNFQAKCMTALTRLQESGTTILFVSHDIGLVKSLCSRGIYLEHGKIHALGDAPDISELYMKNMRKEMNANVDLPSPVKKIIRSNEKQNKKIESTQIFKQSKAFDERVKLFRYGSGGAKIKYVELLNDEGESIIKADFNQKVSVVIHFETYTECELSCNYYISDDKKNNIIGSGMRLAGASLLQAKEYGQYVVIYKTALPLCEGNYSIQIELTQPVVLNQTAAFLDVIDNAVVFNIARNSQVRIWAQVALPNTVQVIEV